MQLKKKDLFIVVSASTEKYSNLDGLRTAGALFVLLMHVYANGGYDLGNSIVTRFIANGGEFVKMFFIISAFGMCCGYYNRFKNGEISLNDFYLKRYMRIFPFFAFLVILDIIISHENVGVFYEAFADLTLQFGFLPGSNIEVIGVGWTLGVIFAFYCLFPFFIFAVWTKKRAWFSLAVSLFFLISCHQYFLYNGSPARCNFIRWSCFFISGGLIFLYRYDIKTFICNRRIIVFISAVCITIAWLYAQMILETSWIYELLGLIVFAVWIMYAVSVRSRLMSNRVTEFFSEISFEIYLSHMLIYRIAEKMGILHLSADDILSYVFAAVFVATGTALFAYIGKKSSSALMSKIIDMARV